MPNDSHPDIGIGVYYEDHKQFYCVCIQTYIDNEFPWGLRIASGLATKEEAEVIALQAQRYVSNMSQLELFVKRVEEITKADMAVGHGTDVLFRNHVEETGEFANAVTVEEGVKQKDLKENSVREAIDVVITALSLFFARISVLGGSAGFLPDYGMQKLDKWEKRVKKAQQGTPDELSDK